MEIPILFYFLTESSYAIPHAVKHSWLVVQLMSTGLHLLGINPPSDHLLTRGSGFLLIHIDAKQNYLHLNHWNFLESKCYEKVGLLARSLDESHSVGQRLCLSGWFVHSWTRKAPTSSKNLALVVKCQCEALKLLALQLSVICKWSASPAAGFGASGFGHLHTIFRILSGLSEAVSSNECKWKLWLSISKQSVASHHWHRTLFIQLLSAGV